jgi:hypothetical protein
MHMKKTSILFAALACWALTGCNNENTSDKHDAGADTTATASAASTEATALAPPPDSATMTKAWMDYATPGDMHKWLASGDGTWMGETTMWMHPSQPPVKSSGSKAVFKMVYGGKYQESKHTGDMMGMPFEGTSVTGYDNALKKFVSTWYDNMGTGLMNMEGTWDDASKTLTMKGKCTDMITGKEFEMRETLHVIDEKTRKMEMYTTQWGPETKCMEIDMKKQ